MKIWVKKILEVTKTNKNQLMTLKNKQWEMKTENKFKKKEETMVIIEILYLSESWKILYNI